MTIPEIHTERLTLKTVNPEVLDHVYAHFSDWEIMDFLGLPTIDALTKEKNKYNKGLTTFNKSFLYFTITDNATGKVIGWCGYHTWYTQHNRAEIGYGLYCSDYMQKGIMSEAVKAVLDYGFNNMNLHRVEAMTATYNTASIKTLAKFGFIQEGVLRQHYLVEGIMEDSLMFSLLKHEYLH
ncbi:GNAT family N-acetyltransferase [Flavobacterium sp. Sd200]|uniref:GNAT family N-acetyltransferase n=1 Tax=Flavobacterium sp. Sd200 TaxID=2692211 RepID=UPI0013695A05|nr:GNAT family protein [Flavobacterium sp. Sd200]MXN91625.1 GNAT family N-acetyltransferase [Flavobacterium sp. Sd200]